MRRRIVSLAVGVVLLAGSLGGSGAQAVSSPEACPVSTFADDKPADKNTAAFTPKWLRNAERTIWAGHGGAWFAGENKVLWSKPAGARLQITAQRLDGRAATFKANTSDGYRDFVYQASGLFFSSAGCWKVEARTGESRLEFVIEVFPRTFLPSRRNACENFADVATHSDMILAARLEAVTLERGEFSWETFQVVQGFKGAARREGWIEVLRDSSFEPPLEAGSTYLLFLAAEPGTPWRLLCIYPPPVEVTGEQIKGVIWDEKIATLADLEKRLQSLAATPTPGR